MDTLEQALFEKLIESGPRLSWIIDWLLKEVWSKPRYLPCELFHGNTDEINV